MILLPFYVSNVFAQTQPTITNLEPVNFRDDFTAVSFNTDIDANTTVVYGVNGSLDFTVTDPAFATTHSVDIPTQRDNMYSFKVTVCSQTGACTSSAVDTFVAGADTTLPAIK